MKILAIKNIGIKINLAILPLLLVIYLNGYIYQFSVLFLILLFHESGHLISAIITKVKIKEINIFPLGAIIRFEYPLGIDPIKEIIISIAGPLSNLILIIFSYSLLKVVPNNQSLNLFIELNILLFLINIMPVLPLDGGRVLRGVLYMQGGLKFSTKYITIIGKVTLTLLFCIGLFFTKDIYEVLVLIILILYILKAAKAEREMAAFILTKSITRKKVTLDNKLIMKAHFLIALNDAKLKSILDIILPHRYNIIFIIDKSGKYLGKVTEESFFSGIIEYGCNENIETLLIDKKKC